MKSYLLIFVLVSFCHIANSQEEMTYDHYILGGSANFTTSQNANTSYSIDIGPEGGLINYPSSGDVKNTNFSFSPYIGKELNPHWILGIRLNYFLSRTLIEDILTVNIMGPVDLKRNIDRYGIGLFARYTINPDRSFNFFLQPYVDYTFNSEITRFNDEIGREVNGNNLEIGIGGGVFYNINQRLRATFSIGGLQYNTGKWKDVENDFENSYSRFDAGLQLASIFFGFEVRI